MDVLQFIRQMQEIYGDELIKPASELPRPQQALDREMFETAFKDKKADGGRIGFDGGGSPLQRLRQEIVDSMRPYAPGNVTEDQLQLIVKDITLDMTAEQAQTSAKNNFIKLFGMADGGRAGYAGGKLVKTGENKGKYRYTVGSGKNLRNFYTTSRTEGEKWVKENRGTIYFKGSKKGEKAVARTAKEGNDLANRYNKLIENSFNKEDMSKIPSWKSFLEKQKLKHGTVNFYRTNASKYNLINTIDKKNELVNMLIERANNDLKHTPFIDIQKKVSISNRVDTKTWKNFIIKLDSKENKVSKAFNYLYNSNFKLKSRVRQTIKDITGIQTKDIINAGLSKNINYNNNLKALEYASYARDLYDSKNPKTLKEIIDTSAYRAGGNIVWTSDIDNPKLKNRANKNIFDYALRNFNYHQKYKTGKGMVTFYDAKTNKPINWDQIPDKGRGYKFLKPSTVYFVHANDRNKTKWTLSTIDADNQKWSANKKTSGLFDEVFQAKDTYVKLINTKVTDPLNKGKKITFGKLMEEVYQTGFDNFGNPYSIEHGNGVANEPFKNLSIASQRVNSALYHLERNTSLSTKELNAIRKELNKGVFSTRVKNTDLRIRRIIDSTQQLQKDVLVKGKKFNQTELQAQLAKLSTNPRCRFSGGGSADLAFCANEGRNRLEKIILQGGAKGEEGDLAKKILQAGRGLKSALSLRGLLGPAAAAFLAAEEGGYVGYDMFAKGKTFKEAVGDSYFNLALGDRSKIDPTKERDKRLREIGGGPPSQAFRAMSEKEMGELAAYENALKEEQKINQAFFDDMNAKQKLEQAKKFSPAVVDKRQKTYDETRANIRDILKPASVLPLLSVDYDAGKRALEKARGLTTRDQLTSTGPKTFGKIFPPAERSRQSDLEEAEAQILGQDLATLKANPAFKYGRENQLVYPTLGFARGGLSGGDTSGPPPEKGPMSQGLLSLYKNGRKL